MRCDIPVCVVASLLVLSAALPCAGQDLPAIEQGLLVLVVDDRGARVEGRVQQVSDQSIRLAVRGGSADVARERIVRIERPDTVKNGALTGLVVGLSMGLISTASDPQRGAVLVTRTLGNGLICAGIGALIDAAVDSRKTLYERGERAATRITPAIGPGVRSIAVSLEW